MSRNKGSLRSAPPEVDDNARFKALRRVLYERFRIHPNGDWFRTHALRSLVTKAWTEAYGGSDNERLEWLGDAVCRVFAVRFVAKTVPNERRVQVLESYFQRLTKGTFQEDVARTLRLQELALIPPSYQPEVRSQKKLETRDVILGNVFEALVAAVFLQSHEDAEKMLNKLFRMEFPKLDQRMRPFGNLEDRGFSPNTPEEWLGYYVLEFLMTERIYESPLSLYEAHVVREQLARPDRISELAETLNLRKPGMSDIQTTLRYLSMIGTGPAVGGSLIAEEVLRISRHDFARFCRGEALRSALPPPPDPVAAPPTMQPLTALKTMLNGQASNLLPREYQNGDGQTRVELSFRGVVLGIGIHPDPKKAAQLAASDALTTAHREPTLLKVRDGKY